MPAAPGSGIGATGDARRCSLVVGADSPRRTTGMRSRRPDTGDDPAHMTWRRLEARTSMITKPGRPRLSDHYFNPSAPFLSRGAAEGGHPPRERFYGHDRGARGLWS